MLNFAAMMELGLKKAGHEVRTLYPPIVFGKLFRGLRLHKWLAYVDKLVLFPPRLWQAARRADIVHICDHSNALYIPTVKRVPYIVTCHDLLAVRGGLGEQTDCPASPVGKWLQRWILSGLKRADGLACVSKATLADAARLIPGERPTELLPLAVRQDLKPISESEQKEQLKKVSGLDPNRPFVLHVGSSQRRKNREGVLRVFAKVMNKVNAQLVFGGKPLDSSQRRLAKELNISDRIIEAGEVSNDLLAALYGKALTFFFPSRFEGFGWPIAEAQLCGCPVVCSSRDPFPEVAGEGALMRDVEDETGFADDIVRMATDPKLRVMLIEKGFENVQRYSVEVMISRYLALYEQALRPQQNPATVHAAA